MLVRKWGNPVPVKERLHPRHYMSVYCCSWNRIHPSGILSDVQPYTYMHQDRTQKTLHKGIQIFIYQIFQQPVPKKRQAWRATLLFHWNQRTSPYSSGHIIHTAQPRPSWSLQHPIRIRILFCKSYVQQWTGIYTKSQACIQKEASQPDSWQA